MPRNVVKNLGLVLMVGLMAGSLSGCGLWRKIFKKGGKPAAEASEEPKKRSVRAVGEVVSVNKAGQFVLIRQFGTGNNFGAGYLYSSVSPSGRAASLRPTGEQLGRFHAADILEGEPQKGDLVVSRRLGEETIPAFTPVPEAPEAGKTPPWLKNIP